MGATWVNAEDLEEGVSCPTSGCGGYLRKSRHSSGYLCEVCGGVFQGK